jgi:glycosyltransferase involved in cell wall biosynthesis
MRVLQLGKYYYPYMGGIETHLDILCRGLRRHVDVEAMVFNTRAETVHETVEGVPVTRCGQLLRFASNSVSLEMIAEISRRDFDVLHLHVPNPLAGAAYMAARKPKGHRLVITHHSDIVRQVALKQLIIPFMRLLLKRADAIVATSPDYLASSKELRPYKAKCQVIPYGIEVARLEPKADDRTAAQKIRRSFPGPIILGVGRLIYYKGFEIAVRAMATVGATLLLIGDGALRSNLESLARELGLTGRIHFIGEVHNRALLPYYLASDIFVLPSIARSEAFGIVQLEAMACGLPVVNTKLSSGVPFASRDGETGLTVPPGDAGALAAALRHLLDHQADRERFGKAGRRRVEQRFESDRMTSEHVKLYESILSQSSAH